MKKILKCLIYLIITVASIITIVEFELKNIPVGSSIGGLIAGLVLGPLKDSFIDITDNTDWKTSQRRLERAKMINKNTKIRISFSYLFRIKIQGKYFLVKNARGTGKYQPVGGVYKYKDIEGQYLRKEFSAEDDDKIPSDESSKNDYRLNFEDQYLRKFVKRFNKTEERENLSDLSREFKEELIDTGILNINDFKNLTYTYYGRHITEVAYGEHFRCFEMLLADIVELNFTSAQEDKFIELINKKSDKYIFASVDEIESLGVKAGSNDLIEKIADHTNKILIENSNVLTQPKGKQYKKKRYTCSM